MKVLFLDFLLIVVGMSDTPDTKKKRKRMSDMQISKYKNMLQTN